MKILFLHRYGKQAAAYRYRYAQFVPYFEKAGIEITSHSLLSDEYLKNKFETGRTSWKITAKAYYQRLRQLRKVENFDLIVIFKEIFPQLPFVLEHFLITSKAPYVLDYDDAIFHSYESIKNPLKRWILGKKFEKLVGNARAVIAGSHYLADYATRLGTTAHIIPTVVDLAHYNRTKPFEDKKFSSFNVGWIGAPTSAQFISPALEALEKFKSYPRREVTFVGSGNRREFSTLNPKLLPWNEKTEIDDLLRFDVGIMPLIDDPWCRGKCGFKLIQYMACGLPVIASPVGANNEIVRHGENGFLANTTDEWTEYLEKCASDPGLCQRLGSQGRKDVAAQFSVQSVVDRLINIYKSSA